jgi:phosphatidylglycerol:prolipoprotein diacylglycerol transferase
MFTPPQYLALGPLTIYFYSLFIVIGIILGYLLARPEGRRFKFTSEELLISIFYAVIPGIIGARLYHVIDQWSRYSSDPLQAFAIWNGGLGILGALAGGLFGLWLFARIYKKPLLRLLDIYAPSLLLAQAIGRFGNWTNQEAFGQPTNLPWGIYIDPAHRPLQYVDATHFHPTFFYEAAFDFAGLALLLGLRPRLRSKPGAVLGAYLVIYGVGRFIVEFFRFDTAHIGGIATAHLIAAALVIGGIYLLARRPKSA